MDMEKRQPRGSLGVWGLVGAFVIVLALFASQAFAASITVTPDPLFKPVPSVYRSVWSSADRVRVWKFTPALSGSLVTTITVTGREDSSGARSTRVELLDSLGAVLTSGCAVTSGTFSNVVINVIPDVTWSTVKTVRGTAVAAC
jgi:hypothetical protein